MNRCISAALPLMFLFIFFISCKKSNDPTTNSSTPHTITYKLTADNYRVFSNILYTDVSGALVSASAEDSTAGWSKTVSIKTPYQAIIEVIGSNSSPNSLNYKLFIYVDGLNKESKEFTAAAFESFDQKIYVILN